jgi:predicted RNase H-like HicB family nuclease
MTRKKRTLDEYLRFNYPIELRDDRGDGGVFVQHPDLDGCAAQGDTPDEALKSLAIMRELWIRARYEDNLFIPDPPDEETSGRVLVRMPPWLHARLLKLAQRAGMSLNQYVSTALSEFVGGAPYRGEVQRLEELVARLEAAIARQEIDQEAATTPREVRAFPRTLLKRA